VPRPTAPWCALAVPRLGRARGVGGGVGPRGGAGPRPRRARGAWAGGSGGRGRGQVVHVNDGAVREEGAPPAEEDYDALINMAPPQGGFFSKLKKKALS
jgi:hypothetical protein